MKILVAGGAGYIGSHTCIELIKNNHEVIIVDNFYNSKRGILTRLEKITGTKIKMYEADCANYDAMKDIFLNEPQIDGVINFAGYKAVGESVFKALDYYDNNLNVSINLLKLMKEFKVNNIVFSSSATVYGNPKSHPFSEDFETFKSTSPYGTTKLVSEYIFEDVAYANKELNISILRYFNPIGAHESGLIGEDPNGIPNNLIPYISQVAIGKLEKLTIYGNDYDTVDGTGVRDYIHVVDLAIGHIKALEYLNKNKPGFIVHNLGTGNGVSVLEMVNAFMEYTGVNIPYVYGPRREGDIATSYASTSKSLADFGFKTQYDLKDMIESTWKWQKNNPNGIE